MTRIITEADYAAMTRDEFRAMVVRLARESRLARGMTETVQDPLFYELLDGILLAARRRSFQATNGRTQPQ